MENTVLDFQKDVLETSKKIPVVVDFWAEWCGPCRILGPVLEKLAAEANGAWHLVKINTEEQQQISMQFGIRSIPAVKMFSDGQVVAEFVGALPEVQVRQWLDKNLPTKSKKLFAEARAALERGDKEKAKHLFESIVALEESNFEARIQLALLVFASEPERALSLVIDVPPEHPQFDQAAAIQTLSRLMNDLDYLTQKAKDANQSLQAWNVYLQGIQALKRQDYETVLRHWIEALQIDRQIDDDGPRKACVALFTWLGHDHELTQKYHRAFTSSLF